MFIDVNIIDVSCIVSNIQLPFKVIFWLLLLGCYDVDCFFAWNGNEAVKWRQFSMY